MIFNILLPNQGPEFTKAVSDLLSTIDKEFGDNNGVLGFNDFLHLKRSIEKNTFVLFSFFIVMRSKIVPLYSQYKKAQKIKMSDFVFATTLAIILMSIIKEKENSREYVNNHKDEITTFVYMIYGGYSSFIHSSKQVEKMRSFMQKVANKMFSRCKKTTLPINDHVEVIKGVINKQN
jgi:hypothetical protein